MAPEETKAAMSVCLHKMSMCVKALELQKNRFESAKAIHELGNYVRELEQDKNVTVSKMEHLEGLTRKASETILKYEDVVFDCLVLDGVSEDKVEEDPRIVQKSKFQDSPED